MTRHGRFLTRRQVAMMIDAVDVNDDGEIDYEEFLVSLTLKFLMNFEKNFTKIFVKRYELYFSDAGLSTRPSNESS